MARMVPASRQEVRVEHPMDIDLSSLSWRDAAEIALQRTDHLLRLPGLGSPSYHLWKRHRPALLHAEARLRRNAILERAAADLEAEFRDLERFFDRRPIRRMVDIGCGHALIDLFFFRRYGCDLHLVDIEQSPERYHDYHDVGAGIPGAERRSIRTDPDHESQA